MQGFKQNDHKLLRSENIYNKFQESLTKLCDDIAVVWANMRQTFTYEL